MCEILWVGFGGCGILPQIQWTGSHTKTTEVTWFCFYPISVNIVLRTIFLELYFPVHEENCSHILITGMFLYHITSFCVCVCLCLCLVTLNTPHSSQSTQHSLVSNKLAQLVGWQTIDVIFFVQLQFKPQGCKFNPSPNQNMSFQNFMIMISKCIQNGTLITY